MSAVGDADPSSWTAYVIAAAGIISGLFGFTNVRINRLENQTKADIDATRAALQKDIDDKSGEHRQGQQQLWSELRLAEIRSNDHRARVQERIGQLPTREEMKQDLGAMEKRIENMLHNSNH